MPCDICGAACRVCNRRPRAPPGQGPQARRLLQVQAAVVQANADLEIARAALIRARGQIRLLENQAAAAVRNAARRNNIVQDLREQVDTLRRLLFTLAALLARYLAGRAGEQEVRAALAILRLL